MNLDKFQCRSNPQELVEVMSKKSKEMVVTPMGIGIVGSRGECSEEAMIDFVYLMKFHIGPEMEETLSKISDVCDHTIATVLKQTIGEAIFAVKTKYGLLEKVKMEFGKDGIKIKL